MKLPGTFSVLREEKYVIVRLHQVFTVDWHFHCNINAMFCAVTSLRNKDNKHEMQNAKCEMQNTKCETQNVNAIHSIYT